MADLRKLTVRDLRALARRHLGPGSSRLRTRRELVAALSKVLTPPAEKQPAKASPAAPPKSEPKPEPKAAPRRTRKRPAPATSPPSPPPAPSPAEPVAVDPLPRDYDEQLGELPATYGEDAVVLLPKDPRTLYLYWDLSPATVERAFAWMPGLRTRLRLLEGGRLLRELDFVVEARSWYFHGLSPGSTYRVEMMALAEDGQVRHIGPPSNPARLPLPGPSRHLDDRFVRVPFDLPSTRLAEALKGSLPPPPSAPPAARPSAPPQGAGPAPFAGAPTGVPAPVRPPRTAAPVPVPAPLPSPAPPPAGGLRSPALAARAASPIAPVVEPPPFAAESRERIYQVSGGAARSLGASEPGEGG